MANKAKTTAEDATPESQKSEEEYIAALEIQQRRIAELAGFEAENRGLREELEKTQAANAELAAQLEALTS